MPWNEVLLNYGMPWTVVLAIIFTIWKGCYKIAAWMAPRLDGLYTSHTKLIETLTEEMPKQTSNMEIQSEILKAHQDTLVEIQKNTATSCVNFKKDIEPPNNS